MTARLGARDAGAALTPAAPAKIPLLVPAGRQMAPFVPAITGDQTGLLGGKNLTKDLLRANLTATDQPNRTIKLSVVIPVLASSGRQSPTLTLTVVGTQ